MMEQVIERVGLLPGSREELFGQGHNRSELEDSTGRRHNVSLTKDEDRDRSSDIP